MHPIVLMFLLVYGINFTYWTMEKLEFNRLTTSNSTFPSVVYITNFIDSMLYFFPNVERYQILMRQQLLQLKIICLQLVITQKEKRKWKLVLVNLQ